MIMAYIVIITLALVCQLAFTFLYWKWIPSWVRNPYGRLAQLDSWSQILLFSFFLILLTVGPEISTNSKRAIAAICLMPFIFVGFFKLILLKKAVDSAKQEDNEEEGKND